MEVERERKRVDGGGGKTFSNVHNEKGKKQKQKRQKMILQLLRCMSPIYTYYLVTEGRSQKE
jgi:hypothetical protein